METEWPCPSSACCKEDRSVGLSWVQIPRCSQSQKAKMFKGCNSIECPCPMASKRLGLPCCFWKEQRQKIFVAGFLSGRWFTSTMSNGVAESSDVFCVHLLMLNDCCDCVVWTSFVPLISSQPLGVTCMAKSELEQHFLCHLQKTLDSQAMPPEGLAPIDLLTNHGLQLLQSDAATMSLSLKVWYTKARLLQIRHLGSPNYSHCSAVINAGPWFRVKPRRVSRCFNWLLMELPIWFSQGLPDLIWFDKGRSAPQ